MEEILKKFENAKIPKKKEKIIFVEENEKETIFKFVEDDSEEPNEINKANEEKGLSISM